LKDIYQVLREKELAVARIKKELEALRYCLPLLSETEAASRSAQPMNESAKSWPTAPEPDNPTSSYQN